jgi:hypothetical protein
MTLLETIHRKTNQGYVYANRDREAMDEVDRLKLSITDFQALKIRKRIRERDKATKGYMGGEERRQIDQETEQTLKREQVVLTPAEEQHLEASYRKAATINYGIRIARDVTIFLAATHLLAGCYSCRQDTSTNKLDGQLQLEKREQATEKLIKELSDVVSAESTMTQFYKATPEQAEAVLGRKAQAESTLAAIKADTTYAQAEREQQTGTRNHIMNFIYSLGVIASSYVAGFALKNFNDAKLNGVAKKIVRTKPELTGYKPRFTI